jgi:hypothetical protein
MPKRDKHAGMQKGAQEHAEGGHGDKTEQRIIEQLESGDDVRRAPMPGHHARDGHRLAEDRQQHDEAEKNSEKTRELRELERDPDSIPGTSLDDIKGRPGGEPGH